MQETPPPLEIGNQVRTPSGAVAEVIAIYPDRGEALVQWSNGERAPFRFGVLKLWKAPT